MFGRVKKNIQSLRAIKSKLNLKKPKISMEFLSPSESNETKSHWYNFWQGSMDHFYAEIGEAHNFNDGKSYKKIINSKKRLSCERPFKMVQILWNGDVSICCVDYEGKEIYGNVKNNSIENIMKSEKYQKMLKIHKNKKFYNLSICDNCDQLVPANLKNILARLKFKYLRRRYAGK